jgi:probable rRNA maturation factor
MKVRGLTAQQLRRAVRAALADRQIASLGVVVVDDAIMAGLHERYFNDRRPTDVISFDLRDEPASKAIEGEIVVSAQTARRAAKDLGLTQRQEVLRYAIHGALHLAGYDDRTPALRRRMRQREDEVLAALGEMRQRVATPKSRGL